MKLAPPTPAKIMEFARRRTMKEATSASVLLATLGNCVVENLAMRVRRFRGNRLANTAHNTDHVDLNKRMENY